MVDDYTDGGVVKGRTHREEAIGAHFSDQSIEVLATQAGFLETLDVFQIHPVLHGWMDKTVKMPVLQLEREFELGVVSAYRAELANHFEAVLDVPHMVVGQL